MPSRNRWTVRENEMVIERVFAWLGPRPWERIPPNSQIAGWAADLYRCEPQHSESSWHAKFGDVLSCLPIPTVKARAGRPAGSVRKPTGGAKGPTVEGPSTRELVQRRLGAVPKGRVADTRKDVMAAWQQLGDALQEHFDALERRR